MPKPHLKYVLIERSRGKIFYYFRRGKGMRIRLPDDYGSPEFNEAYSLALKCDLVGPREEKITRFNGNRANDVETTLLAAIRRAKFRAREKGLEFDLDYEWVIDKARKQDFKCCLTGIPFFMPTAADSNINPY